MSAAPWLPGVIVDICAFLDLPEGWDSYGSPPIDPVAVETMRRLLAAVAVAFPDAPRPHACPTAWAGVLIECWAVAPGIEVTLGAERARP